MVDVYRQLKPTAKTWWSNRGQSYANNVGWRLDYNLATHAVAELARTEDIYKQQRFSDHAPVMEDYKFSLCYNSNTAGFRALSGYSQL